MFEAMIAKKYIASQKRHSALTICSIAIALALITMLFTVFSTVLMCVRSYAYYQEAYHIQISSTTGYYLSEEQYNAIADAVSEYGTCTPEKIFMSNNYFEEYRYKANILLDKDIDSVELFMHNVVRSKTGIDGLQYTTNELLIFCDLKDAYSRYYMVATIALFYAFVLFLIMMLRLIIDTAFEISSKERERQFGVLQSVGATPKQIVRIITYEGLMLSVIGIPLGLLIGIGLGYLVYRAVLGTGLVHTFLSMSTAAEIVHFSVNPWLLLLGVITGAMWVMFSAYGTGMRIIKMSPVQAISQRSNNIKKVRGFSLFGRLFGWTGKIASRNNMRQPKRFIVTVVSLTLSIALFSAMTIVVNNLQRASKDYYGNNAAPSDFSVYIGYSPDDPLQYTRSLKPIEESGLFKDVYMTLSARGFYDQDNPHTSIVWVTYFSRSFYNDLFGGEPPVSYDELAKSGGYIINKNTSSWLGLGSDKNVSLFFNENRSISISEEEYNALPPDEQKKYYEYYTYASDEDYNNGIKIKRYGYTPSYTVDFDLYYTADLDTGLIATIDQYENGAYKLFKDSSLNYNSIYLNLADPDDYYKAIDFFEQNEIHVQDYTAENRQLRAILASINVIATFFSVLIGLIAVVNMVNILSTGILNRRGELAAMQCVGMTERQMYKMTVIECLQYSLTSGILAIGVCELLIFLTDKIIHISVDIAEDFGQLFMSYIYIEPVPIILLSSLCAFIIAIAASIIPLRAMRKTPLVEQIRNVE